MVVAIICSQSPYCLRNRIPKRACVFGARSLPYLLLAVQPRANGLGSYLLEELRGNKSRTESQSSHQVPGAVQIPL